MTDQILDFSMNTVLDQTGFPERPTTYTYNALTELGSGIYMQSPYDYLKYYEKYGVIDCGRFILGPECLEPHKSLSQHWEKGKEIKYGSVVLFYDTKEGNYREYNHIGITMSDGRIFSKIGRGPVCAIDSRYLETIYGQSEYFNLKTITTTDFGFENIYIMPRYSYLPEPEGLNLIITNGRVQIGSIYGLLTGSFGQESSEYKIISKENLFRRKYPSLLEDVLVFIRDYSGCIADKILY